MEKTGFIVPRADSTVLQIRRKYVPPSFNTPYFRDSILSVPGYVFEKVRLPRIVMYAAKSHVKEKGNTMGGYRKLDTTRRGEQLEGWVKCNRKDCTRAYKRVGLPSTGGSHVRLYMNSLWHCRQTCN